MALSNNCTQRNLCLGVGQSREYRYHKEKFNREDSVPEFCPMLVGCKGNRNKSSGGRK